MGGGGEQGGETSPKYHPTRSPPSVYLRGVGVLSCVETSVEGSREGRPGRQSPLKDQVTGLAWKRV